MVSACAAWPQELYGKCELQRESGGGIEDVQPPSLEGEPGTFEPSPAACSGSGAHGLVLDPSTRWRGPPARPSLARSVILTDLSLEGLPERGLPSPLSPHAPHGAGDASFRGVPEAGQPSDLTWQQPAGWGLRASNASALAARVCPNYAHSLASSLCHILDEYADHSCFSDANCGVDAGALAHLLTLPSGVDP